MFILAGSSFAWVGSHFNLFCCIRVALRNRPSKGPPDSEGYVYEKRRD
jgi:hypothetical protein